MSEPNILELEKIHKVFKYDLFKKPVTAVNDLSCVFPKGQCTGFMGHNGAGKTTSIRMIFGLLQPDRGQILFQGRPIKREDKRLIGYMPEVNKLPLNLNALEILSYQLRIYRPPHIERRRYSKVIEEKLSEAGLWEHRKKSITQLSKGMGRRLAWAQATIHDPEVLILDEPFSGLDPFGRQQMADQINQLRERKKSILLCTHELWSVNEVCDQLHIISSGKIVYSSLQEGRDHNPSASYQLSLSGCTIHDLKELQNAHKVPGWSWHEEHGYSIKLWFNTYIDAAAWLKLCSQHGLIIANFQKTHGFQEHDLIRYFKGDISA